MHPLSQSSCLKFRYLRKKTFPCLFIILHCEWNERIRIARTNQQQPARRNNRYGNAAANRRKTADNVRGLAIHIRKGNTRFTFITDKNGITGFIKGRQFKAVSRCKQLAVFVNTALAGTGGIGCRLSPSGIYKENGIAFLLGAGGRTAAQFRKRACIRSLCKRFDIKRGAANPFNGFRCEDILILTPCPILISQYVPAADCKRKPALFHLK